MPSSLREELIRTVETRINNRNEIAKKLEAELETIWAEIEDARYTLRFLKTGKDDYHQINNHQVKNNSQKRTPKRYADFYDALLTFGDTPFGYQELADKLGISKDAVRLAFAKGSFSDQLHEIVEVVQKGKLGGVPTPTMLRFKGPYSQNRQT